MEKDYKGLTIADALTCLFTDMVKEACLVNAGSIRHETIYSDSTNNKSLWKATFILERQEAKQDEKIL